jgi:alpha-tubulin suppressor-like RCC1 family protein
MTLRRPLAILRFLVAPFAAVVLTVGCGGSDDAALPASTTIGAAGGTVSGGGAQVVVPPGALSAATSIAIDPSSSGSPALPGGFTAAGPMFAITPHGTTFAVPVTVTVPIDASRVPAGQSGSLYKTDAAGAWQRVDGAVVSGSTVTAQVSSFSFFGFGSAPPVIPASQQPQDASVLVGATATFAVNAIGAPPFLYRWQQSSDGGANWTDVGVATRTYTTAATSLAENGLRIRVIVSNPDGPTTSQAAILTVTATPPPPPPPPPPASAPGSARIAAGNGFSLAVDAAGVPYSWGVDATGQLGNGAATGDRSTAAPLGTITAVRSVSAGSGSQGVAVMSDGSVRAWGYRGSIDCAFGATAPAPIVIAGASGIVAASTGGDHTLLLRNDGVVLSFGCNDSGQLGRSGASPSTSATVVPGLPAIVAVAAGSGYSLALDSSGRVWSWGRGALGDGSAPSLSRPAPALVTGLSNVTAIAAGTDHALALAADGSVAAWGSNVNGKLGDGGETAQPRPVPTLLTQRITAIAAGEDNSLALRDDGVVLAWGINETGQLGSGLSSPGYRPQPAPVVGLTGVVAVAFGKGLGHGLALRSDGSVWAWGRNDAGQLGDGSTATRLAPVAVVGLNLN